MTTKHTPGPWIFCFNERGSSIDAPIGGYMAEIAVVYSNDGADEPFDFPMEANGHLIAAAPDLLAELRRDLDFALHVLDYLKVIRVDTKDVLFTRAEMRVSALRAAIAKAEGRS